MEVEGHLEAGESFPSLRPGSCFEWGKRAQLSGTGDKEPNLVPIRSLNLTRNNISSNISWSFVYEHPDVRKDHCILPSTRLVHDAALCLCILLLLKASSSTVLRGEENPSKVNYSLKLLISSNSTSPLTSSLILENYITFTSRSNLRSIIVQAITFNFYYPYLVVIPYRSTFIFVKVEYNTGTCILVAQRLHLPMARSLPSLLLLPPPPEPLTQVSLSAAYRPAISAAITAFKNSRESSELQILVPYQNFRGRSLVPRAEVYEEAQKLLAAVYSLLSIICAKSGVEVDADLPGSVDARVILLDYNSSQTFSQESTFDSSVAGPVIDLPTFAATRRQWATIFSVEGEQGQGLLAGYLHLANQNSPALVGHVHLINGGLSLVQNISQVADTRPSSSSTHHVVAVGGTFDHLHAGHKLLLTATSLLLQPAGFGSTTTRRLIIGITGAELLKNKKYAEYLKSWKQRQEDVVDFLLSILSFTRGNREQTLKTLILDEPGPNGHAVHVTLVPPSLTIECVEIQDPFGPTITDEDVTALVVSAETRSGGQAVNQKRTEKGWKALEVFEVAVLDALDEDGSSNKTEDFASKISSTEIRKRRAETARNSSL